MSGTGEEEKEAQKAVPLDLARNQVTTVRTLETKGSFFMTNQLRGMRVLTQGVPTSSVSTSTSGQAIITTNIVPGTVIKPEKLGLITTTQPQGPSSRSGSIQRPSQITLSTPVVAQAVATGASYHVPRGPAVVANIAAPRSNVATVRTPMVVTAPTGQIKGTPPVLSSPVRATTVTGKPQLISRSQTGAVVRSGTILQNAITIGQSGQLHSFKPGAGGIQAIGNTVTIAQVIPRTQAVVYSSNAAGQFTPARITVASSVPAQRQATTGQARLTVPLSVTQAGARLVSPAGSVLTTGTRITTTSTAPRVTTVPSVSVGRLSVAPSPSPVSSTNILSAGRISTLNLQSLVAVANPTQARGIQAQGTKVITQPASGTIHLTPLQSPIKTTQSIVSTSSRGITVPATIVAQRQTPVPSQTISIAKVFPSGENQGSSQTANVFIHTQVQPSRRSSPSPTNSVPSTNASLSTTTVALASGAYFYETTGTYSVARSFPQQPTSFAAISSSQQIRPAGINSQVHGLVTNQPVRFNSVMVVESNRGQQFQQEQVNQEGQQQHSSHKVTSSPRPSILRKREHEGSPLKAAKNITPVLQALSNQAPVSPPSRPDSRGNGHSSGGSTTISATSSPGLTEGNEDSMPHAPVNIKEEEDVKPPAEMTPRKKPRKQQLTGNDLDEHNDDMQFISDNRIKKEEESDGNQSDEPRDGAPEAGQVTTVRKPATASLLNSYKQNWKATHNHYLRYSDVRPKDERPPNIMDLANQYRVQEKVNGWKIYHLTTQMDDLADQEDNVYNKLTDLLKCSESVESAQYEVELNRINELIKGNLQRVKIINDGMHEAKSQIMKIFDHKVHVTDIINRCASKRNFKKREKS